MRPAPFEYAVAQNVNEVIATLSEFGDDAKILAGGQSLLPLLNFRLANPRYLIDVNRLADLDYVRPLNGGLTIGAMTRQRTIERSALIRDHCPLMFEAIQHVGHRQTRNRGTLGGSLAHADPAAELPAVVTALGGSLRIAGTSGERRVTPDDFFRGILTTAIAPNEMLVAVDLPPWPSGSGACFCEFSRRHGDFAVVGAAAIVALDDAGKVDRVGLSLMGVGRRPFDASGVATAMLRGERADDPSVQAVAERVERDVQPDSDIHAPAEYRKHLAKTLARKVLLSAAGRATTRES